jgi:hypothetical protein
MDLEIYGYIQDDIIICCSNRYFKFSFITNKHQKIKHILHNKIYNKDYTFWSNHNTLFINIIVKDIDNNNELYELKCNEIFPYIDFNLDINTFTMNNNEKERLQLYINCLKNKINNLQGENNYLQQIINLYDI